LIIDETPDYLNVVSDANIYDEDTGTGIRNKSRKFRRLPEKDVGTPFQ